VGHLYQEIPNGTQSTNMMEYVYDLGLGEPEDFLNELLDADEKG
jgi:hypothetical protein